MTLRGGPARRAPARPGAVTPTTDDRAAIGVASAGPALSLRMAVPRKVLRRAVDRNAVKRVFRELWRNHAVASADRSVLADPAGRSGGSDGGGTVVHLRLTGKPPDFPALSRPQRKRFWRGELAALLDSAHR